MWIKGNICKLRVEYEWMNCHAGDVTFMRWNMFVSEANGSGVNDSWLSQ